MPVVTVSRELGSLGTRIAEAAGARLGAPCVDKEVLAEMARQAGVPVNEIVESEEKLLSRPMVVSEEMRAFFSRRGESGVLTAENYVERMSAAIRALAEQGNTVFVGRGAQLILPGAPGVLHVHIFASPEIRAKRIQERRGLGDEQAALQIVRQADERRRTWFRRFFTGANWKDPRYYDLMINTGRIPAQTAVELIVAAALSEPE
ncbi:MAG: cytidylate kinase-like family protein [Chloroflexota bacterium]|jgi:cytidylate kinase|nr:cytidylate kinase-like family protein [Chloroflexota bacterium]